MHLSLALGARVPRLASLRFAFLFARFLDERFLTPGHRAFPSSANIQGRAALSLDIMRAIDTARGLRLLPRRIIKDARRRGKRAKQRERERRKKLDRRGEVEEIERRKPRGWYRGMENGRFRRCCFFCFRRWHEYSSTRICIGSRSRKRRTGRKNQPRGVG